MDNSRRMTPLNTNEDLASSERKHGPSLGIIIFNVRLAHTDTEMARKLWTVICSREAVLSVSPYNEGEDVHSNLKRYICLNAYGGLLLPSLCHSHIHLDKCFILSHSSDLVNGDFQEAMCLTARVKSTFSLQSEDLIVRGRRLIQESLDCGVTSMRAHVEVDDIVGMSCIDVAAQLKTQFRGLCDIEICVFAQEAFMTSTGPGPSFVVLLQAVEKYRHCISAIGSAPYVESTVEERKKNINAIMNTALQSQLHVDFHLDYNLNKDAQPLIYDVITFAREIRWPAHNKITIGHATRLQLLSSTEWVDLACHMNELPIHLVGLPQSDMYMMGREYCPQALGAPRGTLNIPKLASEYGIQVAMSVNNVQNAFTPQGSVDPLSLCTLGVALFQDATPAAIRALAYSVTLASQEAIGLDVAKDLYPCINDRPDFVILHDTQSLQDAVLNPSFQRTTVKNGSIVARRTVVQWDSSMECNPVLPATWFQVCDS